MLSDELLAQQLVMGNGLLSSTLFDQQLVMENKLLVILDEKNVRFFTQ